MQHNVLSLGLILLLATSSPLKAQYSKQERNYKACFVGSTLFIWGNLSETKTPDSFKQLDDKWSKFFIGEPGLHFGYNFWPV